MDLENENHSMKEQLRERRDKVESRPLEEDEATEKSKASLCTSKSTVCTGLEGRTTLGAGEQEQEQGHEGEAQRREGEEEGEETESSNGLAGDVEHATAKKKARPVSGTAQLSKGRPAQGSQKCVCVVNRSMLTLLLYVMLNRGCVSGRRGTHWASRATHGRPAALPPALRAP
jgi:hypothetical protein